MDRQKIKNWRGWQELHMAIKNRSVYLSLASGCSGQKSRASRRSCRYLSPMDPDLSSTIRQHPLARAHQGQDCLWTKQAVGTIFGSRVQQGMAEYELPSGNTSSSPGNGSTSQNPPARLGRRDGEGFHTNTVLESEMLGLWLGCPGGDSLSHG